MICCHCANNGLNGPIRTETISDMAAILGATAKQRGHRRRRAFIDVGVHMWNGTAETLKASPAPRTPGR